MKRHSNACKVRVSSSMFKKYRWLKKLLFHKKDGYINPGKADWWLPMYKLTVRKFALVRMSGRLFEKEQKLI